MLGAILFFILIASYLGLLISWSLHFYLSFKFQKLKRGEEWYGLGSFFDFKKNMIKDWIVAGLPLISGKKEIEFNVDIEKAEIIRKKANKALLYSGIFLLIIIIYIVVSSIIYNN